MKIQQLPSQDNVKSPQENVSDYKDKENDHDRSKREEPLNNPESSNIKYNFYLNIIVAILQTKKMK